VFGGGMEDDIYVKLNDGLDATTTTTSEPNPPSHHSPACVRAIMVLAIVTFLLVPLDIIVNIFWSYRLDPVGYFQCYSNYSYSLNFNCDTDDTNNMFWVACESYTSAWWAHKITTILWACGIVIHVCLITVWGKLNWGIHEFLGASVILSSNIAATSGLIMVGSQLVRYEGYTSFFVITAAVFTYVLTILFFLSFVFSPKCFSWKIHHSNFGFLFLTAPLGMLLQFIIYSIIVGIEGSKDSGCSAAPREGDFTAWKISLITCGIGSLIMSISFYHSYFRVTRPTIYLQDPFPVKRTQLSECCPLEVKKYTLNLCTSQVKLQDRCFPSELE